MVWEHFPIKSALYSERFVLRPNSSDCENKTHVAGPRTYFLYLSACDKKKQKNKQTNKNKKQKKKKKKNTDGKC